MRPTPRTKLPCRPVAGATGAWFVVAGLLGGCGHDSGPPQVRRAKLEAQRRQFAAVQGASREDSTRANLYSLLQDLGRARSPAARDKVLTALKSRSDEFHDLVIEILEGGKRQDLLCPAIEVSGIAGFSMALPAIQNLAFSGAPDIRAVAIRAAQELSPWNKDQLGRLLQDVDAGVLVAALDAASRIPDPPGERILELLRHKDFRVRDAAVQAVPRLKDGQYLASILRLATHDDREVSRIGARAIARIGVDARTEPVLTSLLRHPDWMVVSEVLRTLETKPAPLADATAVMALVGDEKVDLHVQAAALVALERTGSTPVEALEKLVPTLHPTCQVLAARCLVGAGQKEGAEWLIHCLGTRESDRVDFEARDFAVHEAHKVLVEIAGKDFGNERTDWIQWLQGVEIWQPRTIEHLPPRSW